MNGEKPLTSPLFPHPTPGTPALTGGRPGTPPLARVGRVGASGQQDAGRRPFVVAIDGPAASGKGTLARRLAEHFGFAHLDTGALYRATALLVLDESGDPADPAAATAAACRIDATRLTDPRLREDAVAGAASVVAAMPEVRSALLDLQRDFAANPPGSAHGSILDGRDIGTVVYPTADLKLFITATVETRASRRVQELQDQGATVIYETVLQDLTERDARDSRRQAAPLMAAPDAEIIDTTMLDIDVVFERAAALVARSLKEKGWQ